MSGIDDTTLRRLRMRSMRRGIKEMDLILSTFAERRLETLPPADVAIYDALLSENDQDLYRWVSGREAPPERFEGIVSEIAGEMARSVETRRI